MATFQISNDGSIGVLNNAGRDINTIHVTNTINVPKQTPKKPLKGIRFQVTNPVASFSGRDDELESVNRAFNKQSNMKPYNLVAVCGYGGIGKTEFARKFVENYRTNFVYIIWILAEFETNICDSFNTLQEQLKSYGYPCSGHQDVYKHLNNEKCLFVFDNVENKKSISKYLPQENNNSLFLITSQYRIWSPYESVELDKLDAASAINIIKFVLGTHDIEISKNQQQKLLSSLEPIPLVLQIGAGFVCQEVLGLKSIGKEYNIDDIIGELSTECELVILEFPPFDQNLYDKSVLVALSHTLDKFWYKEDKVSKTAKAMLGVSAYLSADCIEEYLLKEVLNMEDEKLFNKSLINLVQFSLYQKSDYTSIFTMHRTVQECVRHLCRNKSVPNDCYLQSLHVLLNGNYWGHHELVIQHAEKDIETFKSFCEGNKCRTLYEALARCISSNIAEMMLKEIGFMNDPEFLLAAATSGRDDIIENLLERGANFNVMNSEGGVLYYACLQKDDARVWGGSLIDTWFTIKALIEVGASINLQNSEGNTILHILCNMGKNCTKNDVDIFECCALMIKVEGDPTIKNSAGKTPADLAREHGLPLTLQLLEEVISGCRYIQHIATRCKNFNSLKSLLNFDICSMNEQDESGNTVLHVLAGLDPQGAEEELELPYITTHLMGHLVTEEVAMKNNFGETAADVATRANRLQLADMFNARTSGSIIYRTAVYRQQIEHFFFVSNQERSHVNERDGTGGTLLHALCGLDPHGNTDLELDVTKLVADLVIWYWVDMSIRNTAGVTAVNLARNRGWLLLADFLDGDYATITTFERLGKLPYKLMCLAVKHRQFDLIKYAWWRYYHDIILVDTKFGGAKSCSKLLHILCDYNDPAATDKDIISAIKALNFFKLVAKYDKSEYQEAINAANKCGRNELASWLIKHQTNELYTEPKYCHSNSHEPLSRKKKLCICNIV